MMPPAAAPPPADPPPGDGQPPGRKPPSAPAPGWRAWRRRLRPWHAAVPVVLVVAAFVLIRGFLAGREQATQESEAEQPLANAARVTTVDGQVAVVLPRQAQVRAGILTEPLRSATAAATTLRAYGMVLPLDSLGPQRDAYAAALGRARQAEAQLSASRREFERRQLLYDQNQNVSATALEQARAAMESDQASAAAAQVPARTLAATARQRWGLVVGSWIVAGSPEFSRLLARQDVLVQVTLPPGDFVRQPPPYTSLEPGAGPPVRGRYVSAAAQTDPRIQGMSFFYVAPATARLLPGMNVTANLGEAGAATGALVPEAAVVWAQGSPWVYVQSAPTVFVRRRIVATTPAAGGGYLVTDLAAGTPVVVRGAEMLLSEEFRSQIQMAD